jgi:signal transduction histidine kinase
MNIVQLGLLAVMATPFALAIRLAYAHRRSTPETDGEPSDRDAARMPARIGFAAELLDLELAVRAVARTSREPARALSVRIDLAIDPGLKAWVDPNSLQSALRSTVLAAIQATPGGQVLITGMPLGRQAHIRITDDGKNADQGTRESQARQAEELIALHGGSLRVEVTPSRATTVTIRLPLPGDKTEMLIDVPALAEQAA